MASKWAEISETMQSQRQLKSTEQSISQAGKWKTIASQQQPDKVDNESLSWGEAIKEAIFNTPASLYDQAQNIYTAIRHPIETAKGIGTLAKGAGKAFVSIDDADTETYMALENAVKERYGTVEGFKKTLSEDPAGVLTDMASIVTPVGKLAQSAGLAKTGEKIAKVGAMMEPVNLATKPIRGLASALIPKNAPSKLYEGAVKLSTVLPIDRTKKIVNTALDNQIMPTYSGLMKLSNKIDDLNTQIAQKIDEAVTTGQKIPVDDLFKGFFDAQVDLLKVSGEPIKGAKLFANVEKEIREANKFLGRTDLSPLEAQKMKQRIYKELEKEYSKISLHPIKAEARMLVAKNLKNEIETIVPEIKYLNAKDGELLELRNAITQATRRISNRDLLSLGTTAKAAGGSAVAGVPGMAAGLTLGLLDSQPIIKAKLALVLAKIKSKGINIKPTPALVRLGLAQAGEIEELNNQGE